MLNICHAKIAVKSFLETKQLSAVEYTYYKRMKRKMGEKMDKQHIEELKEMIQEKKTEESVEKVLVKFCARHGVSLDTCRIHYNRLVEKGEIKEK